MVCDDRKVEMRVRKQRLRSHYVSHANMEDGANHASPYVVSRRDAGCPEIDALKDGSLEFDRVISIEGTEA